MHLSCGFYRKALPVCASGYFGNNCSEICDSHCKEARCDPNTGSCECSDGFVLIDSTCREYASDSVPVSQPANEPDKFVSTDEGFPTLIVSVAVSAGSAVVLAFVIIFVCYRRRQRSRKLSVTQTYVCTCTHQGILVTINFMFSKQTRNDTKSKKNHSR
jgi:hypothetical protein